LLASGSAMVRCGVYGNTDVAAPAMRQVPAPAQALLPVVPMMVQQPLLPQATPMAATQRPLSAVSYGHTPLARQPGLVASAALRPPLTATRVVTANLHHTPVPAAAMPAPPPPAKTSHMSTNIEAMNGSLVQLLDLVAQQGFFSGLQPAPTTGELIVSVPFCGSLVDAPALADFAARILLPTHPAAHGVRFLCTDVSLCGAQHMAAAASADPRIQFDVQCKDLGSEALPPVALTLGFHPQPLTKTPDGLWGRILANVLRSSERCLFTCWMRIEAEELVRICSSYGAGCNLGRNPAPFLEGTPGENTGEEVSLKYHFIILASRSASTGSVSPAVV